MWLHLVYLFYVHFVIQCAELNLTNDGNELEPFGEKTCPEEKLEDLKYGNFLFPETVAVETGVQIRIPCEYGFRNDGYQPFLGQTIAADSKEAMSGVTRECKLQTISGPDGDLEVRAVWSPTLADSKSKIIFCKEEGWHEILVKVLTMLERVTFDTFGTLGPFIAKLSQYAQDDYDCAVALINGIARLLTSNPDGKPDGLSSEQRNKLFNITETYSQMLSSRLPPGYKFKVGDEGIIIETAKFYKPKYFTSYNYVLSPYATEFETPEGTNVAIDISTEALQMAIEQKQSDENPELRITAFSHEVFKQWNGSNDIDGLGTCLPIASQNTSLGCEFSEDGCEEHAPPYKAWGLLCIDLNANIKNLAEPIEFFISTTDTIHNTSSHQLSCVYWDEDEQVWSTDGVSTTQLDDGIKCTSSHLTAFSALLEPLPLPFPGAEYAPINNSVHSYILSILSSIGSVLSIVGLGLTLFTYGLFSSLRRERSNRILINLCSSLLFMHIISVSGSKDLWDGYCFVPAVSLHYLVLTSLAWMMVEAIHMFDLLISVFVRPESRFLIKRFVLAWGIPAIVVGVCAAVHPNVYTVGRADLCLMSAHENIYLYYGAFIFPLCIMLLVNLIIFGRIFRVLYKQTKRTSGMSGGNGTGAGAKLQLIKISPLQIKGATSVLVLLGIGWIFGLMAIGPFEVFFRYMFCVVNGAQGLFIFLFRVALNPHACKQWKKVMLGLSPDSSLDVSVTTSTTAGEKRKKRKSTAISPTFISASNSVENSLTASNPLSRTLATALASILKSENERAAANGNIFG